jgi:hypothetical protein
MRGPERLYSSRVNSLNYLQRYIVKQCIYPALYPGIATSVIIVLFSICTCSC